MTARWLLINTAAAQDLAFGHLSTIGCKLLLRSYECALGEIHMIGKHEGNLVFIEVCVEDEKISNERGLELVKAARYYMKRYGIKDVPWRLVKVSVWPDKITVDNFGG